MKWSLVTIVFVAIGLSGCASNPDFDAVKDAPYARAPLTEKDFNKLQVGEWKQAQVLAAFGHPNFVGRVRNFDGPIWSWRYDSFGTPKRFHVFLDGAGVAVQVGTTEEHIGNDRHLRQ